MIKFINSPSICMTAFSASLTNITVPPPLSHDCSYYVNRPILASPPLWLQKHTDLRAHDFAHSADLWHQPRLAEVTYAWSCRPCGINPTVSVSPYLHLLWCASSGLAGTSLPQPRYHLRTPYSLATLRTGFIWTALVGPSLQCCLRLCNLWTSRQIFMKLRAN